MTELRRREWNEVRCQEVATPASRVMPAHRGQTPTRLPGTPAASVLAVQSGALSKHLPTAAATPLPLLMRHSKNTRRSERSAAESKNLSPQRYRNRRRFIPKAPVLEESFQSRLGDGGLSSNALISAKDRLSRRKCTRSSNTASASVHAASSIKSERLLPMPAQPDQITSSSC